MVKDNNADDIVSSRKFVVFETMIDELVKHVRCQICDASAGDIKKSALGTSIHYAIYCRNNHLITEWKAQPLLGRLPAYNLLLSSAIFNSGKCLCDTIYIKVSET